jgi:hypothetical protein
VGCFPDPQKASGQPVAVPKEAKPVTLLKKHIVERNAPHSRIEGNPRPERMIALLKLALLIGELRLVFSRRLRFSPTVPMTA